MALNNRLSDLNLNLNVLMMIRLQCYLKVYQKAKEVGRRFLQILPHLSKIIAPGGSSKVFIELPEEFFQVQCYKLQNHLDSPLEFLKYI